MKIPAQTVFSVSIYLLCLATPTWADSQEQTTSTLAQGEEIVVDRQRGHCLLCHAIAQIKAPFQGNLGPDLSNIGQRLTYAQIRARIADPKRFNPESIMPAYGQIGGFRQLARKYQGTAILTEEELNAVSAYVTSLTLAVDNAANPLAAIQSKRSEYE